MMNDNCRYSLLLRIIIFIIVFICLMIPKYHGLLLYRSTYSNHLKQTSITSVNNKLFSFSSSSSINDYGINSKVFQKSNSESYLSNSRFWSKTFILDDVAINNVNSNVVLLDYVNRYLNNEITNNSIELKDFPRPNIGMVIIPKLNLLIPIHEGKFQTQHAIMLSLTTPTLTPPSSNEDNELVSNTTTTTTNKHLSLTICGFSNRAQQVNVAPIEEERPIDYIRLAALDHALLEVSDITGEELLSAKLAGTSPARIYRSFVAPRPKALRTLEPISRAAKRTATQIELSLRQVRADQATYLRNTDRFAYYNNLLNNDTTTNNNNNIDDSSSTSSNISNNGLLVKQRVHHPVAIVLDNIRSAFNVGSIFRSAETAAVSEVVTCGITAHPPHPKLQKTALSAVDVVPSRHFEDTITAIHKLRSEGYQIIVMETTTLSQMYTDISYCDHHQLPSPTATNNTSTINNSITTNNKSTTTMKKIAMIAGNEVTGVDPRVIEMADIIIEIPTYGIKNSLNVASAVSIVLFEILRQWNTKQL